MELGPGDTSGNTLRAVLGLIPRKRPAQLPALGFEQAGVRVDREHLAAYGKVCGFRLRDELPPTYPHVLAFPLAMRFMTLPQFPFPVIGLVHIANSITVRGPVDAGAVLDFSLGTRDLRPHARGTQFDLHVSARVDGAEVWASTSTYLSRSAQAGGRHDRTEWEAPAATAVWRVPARVGTDYAAVSGDRNPIHTSRVGARLFGFPRTIAHGMWSKARCLAALEGRLPAAYTVDVQFKQPIVLPATVNFAYGNGQFEIFGKRPHLAGQVTPA
ncbi:hypothetical protein JIG36_13835 [Actinoplanes sp. LDG1-06]|uniref:MaoC-like domain-containing protein n=1 Tax=Paractinoplanes ovalisporus TaxID=2810368 RepID=A0ABS2ABI9_9ACTN|nr:MaoC/PaaZ C-terminal domain-containing protein [Actinoplanes ovalisporus]MBM2616641.1 hypothetical protein [Actinoplanes ovalisporus]